MRIVSSTTFIAGYLIWQVFTGSAVKQKKQSSDLDELLGNSPPWPPVPAQTEDEKEIASGEWEDKVMLNKQDEVSSNCWDSQNGNSADIFCQKYLKDYSNNFSEQTYNMFTEGNGFCNTGRDVVDHLDAATSDSSEPESLWQFTQTKQNRITNGVGMKASEPVGSKLARSADLR